ncbi:hypothetical protein Acor_08720 [Acrocarpospora corrugata]|uniref:Uncharacterized protein n=1 Tax=Acrocarpospora corrugata TaxID=35763 RepID=A0A5M3VRJ2_9ACTN|nr:hypothetical protein [Acrocarpospora corrugata]GER98808.1 hypothetical protein Acor_08720 [Acrocarpospora corrugata]
MTDEPMNKRARKRLRQQREAAEARIHYAHLIEVESYLKVDGFAGLAPRPVDFEIICSFDGSPDNMTIWLIFATAEEAERVRDPAELAGYLEHARALLRREGYPQSGVDTLRLDSTSLPEIEDGGGRFFFFR